MIIDDSPQLSPEWFAARCGIPTASSFGKIVTVTGKASSSADTYMNQLLADWYVGKQTDVEDPTKWMERGTLMEAEARETYSFTTGREVEEVGFCYLDDNKLVGASPDGLIEDKGSLEIKCPKASTMIDYLLNGFPSNYKQQVQGQLWITGREWTDFYAYHPDFEPILIRVDRDQEYINIMAQYVSKFITRMLEKRSKLK